MAGIFSDGGGVYDRDVNNDVSVRNVYNGASGATLGQRGAAMSPHARGYAVDSDSDVVTAGASATGGGFFGQPLTWWGVLVFLLISLMYVAKRAGQESEFGNVKMSVYNIVIITIAAIVGIGAAKVVFGRFKVPGLSTFIAAI